MSYEIVSNITPYEHHAKYYETDQMGIIHHSNYVRWMEEARIDMMGQIGLSYKRMEEEGIVIPVINISCEYKSMVRFDDTIVIYANLKFYNGIKMELVYKMFDKKTKELRTVCRSEHCFLDQNARPISLKKKYPELHQRIEKYLEGQEYLRIEEKDEN